MKKKHIAFLGALIVCCLFLFAAFRNGDWFLDHFLPGDSKVTQAALSDFADNLRDGRSFSDAVTTFCKDIIQNA